MTSIASLKTVGFYASPDALFTFREDKETHEIKAEVSNVENPVTVNLPAEIGNPPVFSSAAKVERLLHHRFFQPVYSPSQDEEVGEVSFVPIAPENKKWEIQTEIHLPTEKTQWITLSDGTIGYVRGNKVIICDLESKKRVAISFGTSLITALSELPTGKLIVGDEKGNLCIEDGEPIHFGLNKPITKIIPRDTSHCLLQFGNKKLYVFNIESGTELKKIEPQSELLDSATFSEGQESKECIRFNNDGTVEESKGGWTIAAKTQLSDGSILYAIGSSCVTLYVVSTTRMLISSLPIKYSNAQSMVERVDGSVAIQCEKNLVILQPTVKDTSQRRDYQIEICKLEIRYNPSQLDLYQKLAELYRNDPENQYRTYLAGVESAVKTNDIYLARRFYEKARKIKPESDEPCQLFLFSLENSPYKKQTIQVALDLFQMHGKRTHPSQSTLLDPERKCKKRLLVGEGSYSYTEALIDKHKQTHELLPKSITATELHTSGNPIVQERVQSLKKRGVEVLYGIDGQEIDQKFAGQRFERIQWNCPFGWPDPQSRREFPKVIPNFFLACSNLQKPNDRVHVTLVQGSGNYWKTRQKENPIVQGATLAGYRLIRKRKFDSERYPGYQHVMTGTTQPYTARGEEKEFVFEKMEKAEKREKLTFLTQARAAMEPKTKKYKVDTSSEHPDETDYYFECSTDEDSSDYYIDSDEEKE